MRCKWLLILLVASFVAATATWAQALPVYSHYSFDDTSGTVFTDGSVYNVDATLYRPLRIGELPGVDAANVTVAGQIGSGGLMMGNRDVDLGGVNPVTHDVMVRAPVTGDLPAGDSFAVSYWLNMDNWTGAYGVLAAYNGNGLNWNLGMHNASTAQGLLAWTSDADVGGGGNAQWTANLSTAGLAPATWNHFVVQFEGAAGVTACYLNGTSVVDAADENLYWGNRKEGLILGGRALDVRNFTVPNSDARMDDFAIISGVVNTTDVENLRDNGAVSLGTRRLAHYAMEETTGTQIADSRAYANHGTLVGYDALTMGRAERDVSTQLEPGAFGTAAKFASGWTANAEMASVGHMPSHGEKFTVVLWNKPDDQLATTHGYGWDQAGVIANWSANNLGFSIANYNNYDGSIIIRVSDNGDYFGTYNDYWGVFVGPAGTGSNGLNLDPEEWHHIAVTVDTTLATGKITAVYIDGNPVPKHFGNGYGITDEDTGLLGGRIKSGVLDAASAAFLDDFGVIQGELTEAQIEQIMAFGVASIPEPSTIALLLGVLFTVCLVRRARP